MVTKKLLSWTLLPALLALAFFLFEPVFRWNFGWEALPLERLDVGEDKLWVEMFSRPIEKASARVNAEFAKGTYPGLSVAVGYRGNLLWTKTVGYADIGNKTPMVPTSRLRIGSTAKPITATLAARLVDSGALNLTQSVADLVDYLPESYSVVTTQDLLSHMAGVRNYGFCLCFPIWEFQSKARNDNVASAISHFSNSPLLFDPPGSRFSYTTYGYVVASGALEGAGGAGYPALLKAHVTIPLKMTATSPEIIADDLESASFYDVEGERYKKAFPVDNSNKWAGGGLLSTPTDLVRLGNAWLDDEFLSSQTRAKFLKPRVLLNGEQNRQSYALGWRNNISAKMFNGNRKIRIVHHGGTASGGTSFLVLYPEYGLVFSILTNRSMNDSGKLFDIIVPIAELLIDFIESDSISADQ